MNLVCPSVDMYLSVSMDISGTKNHLSYKIHQILFARHLRPWLSLSSLGGIGYVIPDVDDT